MSSSVTMHTTVYRAAVVAAAFCVIAGGLMATTTLYAFLAPSGHLGVVGAVLILWTLAAMIVAALMVVKCLIERAVVRAVDEVALLLQARDEAPPPPQGGLRPLRHLPQTAD